MKSARTNEHVARSQRDLARAVGRAVSTVNGWVNDDRWPFSRRPPWDVEAVKRWARATLEPQGDDLTPIERQARLMRLTEQVKMLRFRRQRLEEQYMPRAEAEQHWNQIVEALRQTSDLMVHLVQSDPDFQSFPEHDRSIVIEIIQTRLAQDFQRLLDGHDDGFQTRYGRLRSAPGAES